MRTKDELQLIESCILRDMRSEAHLSMSQMADRLGIDRRTYSRYESGESSPTLAAFVAMLDALDAPALPIIKRYLYPDSFSGAASVADHRQRLISYLMFTASDMDIEQLFYILEGPHGSPAAAQLQLFTAFDHLQLDARLAAAKLIFNLWEMESIRGELVNSDCVPPDMALLHHALVKATQAAAEGRSSYTVSIK